MGEENKNKDLEKEEVGAKHREKERDRAKHVVEDNISTKIWKRKS